MNIKLISPSQGPLSGGLLKLLSVIQRTTTHTASIYDWFTLNVEEAVAAVGACDIYVYDAGDFTYDSQLELSRRLKNDHGGLHVLVGPYASERPEDARADGFDCVFVDNSEMAFLQFLCHLDEGTMKYVYNSIGLSTS